MDTTRPAYRTTDPAGTAPVVVRDDPAADPANAASTTYSTAPPTYAAPPVAHDPPLDRPAAVAVDDDPATGPRFSLGATFLGWAVASFFTLLFLAIVAAAASGALASQGGLDATTEEAQEIGIGTLVGLGVALFLAYLIGGYAAGRIALWNGAAHGAGVLAWTVLFGVLAFVLGSTALDFEAVTGANVDLSGLTGAGIVALLVGLVLALAGAMIGGRLGERYRAEDGRLVARRPARVRGGRPL